MSRSTTPARSTTPSKTYGEILGSIFSTGSGNLEGNHQHQYGNKLRSASVEKTLSDLHSTRSNNNSSKSQEARSSVSDEAKRIFRERRREQQKSPGRTSATATTTAQFSRGNTPERRDPNPELRQHQASPGRFATPNPPTSIASGTISAKESAKSRTATPERRHPFRLLPFATSSGRVHLGRSRTPTLPERPTSASEKKHTRHLSSSPVKQRDDYGRESTMSRIPPTHHKQPSYHEHHHQPLQQFYEQRAPPASESNVAVEEERADESKIFSLQKELKELKQRYENEMQCFEKAKRKDNKAMEKISQTVTQMRETVNVQNEQLYFYETRLRDRDIEIENLKQELEQGRKRQASLELELEIHDLKFSIYDDYRRLMDKERLDKKDNIDEDDTDNDDDDNHQFGTSGMGLEPSGWNCQKHILSKLHRLEELFEQSKTEAAIRYSTLYKEHTTALTKMFFLEQRQPTDRQYKGGNMGDECSAMSAESISSIVPTVPAGPIADLESAKDVIGHHVTYSTRNVASVVTHDELLTKRIKAFEADNLRLSLQVQGLREELHRTRAIQNDVTLFKDENEVSALRLQKDSLHIKIAALETEIGFTSGQIDDKTRTRRYRMLEKNLNGYISEIMSLEDKMRAKESVIARLKERDLTRRLGLEANSAVSETLTESTRKWYESGVNEGITVARTTSGSGNSKPRTVSVVVDTEHTMNNSDLPRADLMRNRLNKKIMELKSKTKKQNNDVVPSVSTVTADSSTLTNTDGTQISTSSRVAMLRKRLDEICPHTSDHDENLEARTNTSDLHDLISI